MIDAAGQAQLPQVWLVGAAQAFSELQAFMGVEGEDDDPQKHAQVVF